jgi:hypothetical protein
MQKTSHQFYTLFFKMHLSIDPKLTKLIEKKPDIKKGQTFTDIALQTSTLLKHHDCLLMVSPASYKTTLLLTIASSISNDKLQQLIVPSKYHSYYDRLLSSFPLEKLIVYSLNDIINNREILNNSGVVLIDECEKLENKFWGGWLESLILTLPQSISVVFGMNKRSNIDTFAQWVSHTRQRECKIIQVNYPKRIISTFLSQQGEWLPLLDKKKINKKVKLHLKSKKNHNVSIQKKLMNIIELLNSKKLFPAMVVSSSHEKNLNMWQHCLISESSPGKYLTIPAIVDFFENYPRLKSNPLFFEMLQKRAAFCIPGDIHWAQLIESLFWVNAFDFVFITSDMIHHLYCSFKTILFTGQPETKESEAPLSLMSDSLLMRLDHNESIEQDNDFYCISIDTKDVDPVHLKDYLIPGQNTLKSRFELTFQHVLYLNAQKSISIDSLTKLFSMSDDAAQNDVQFHDIVMEIQADLPYARCQPLLARQFLINYKINLDKKLTEIHSCLRNRTSKKLLIELQKYQFKANCLPCNDCKHNDFCQNHREPRRFKEIDEQLQQYRQQKSKRLLFLQMTYRIFQDYLIQTGFIDIDRSITPKGQLAIQLGTHFNPILIECIQKHERLFDDILLRSSIMAGFIADERSLTINPTFSNDYIYTIYKQFESDIKKMACQLLCMGIKPDLPDFQYSCLYYELVSNKNQQFVHEQSGTNPLYTDLFIETVNSKVSLLNDFLS